LDLGGLIQRRTYRFLTTNIYSMSSRLDRF
jgi:hypothetical protein